MSQGDRKDRLSEAAQREPSPPGPPDPPRCSTCGGVYTGSINPCRCHRSAQPSPPVCPSCVSLTGRLRLAEAVVEAARGLASIPVKASRTGDFYPLYASDLEELREALAAYQGGAK